MIVSSPPPPYDAGSRTRSLFRATGGIGPLSARGEGKHSFDASDAGMLALMFPFWFPETVIVSLPSSPYDAGSRTRSLFRAPDGISPLSARGEGKHSFDASDAGMLAKI